MRIFCTLLGFNTPEMVRGAVENLEKTTTDIEHRSLIKTIFDLGYPGNPPNALYDIAREYGWWHTMMPNQGVMANHNAVIHDYYRMGPGDFYICHDPDVRWQQRGWVSASVEALQSDPNCVFICAALPFHDEKWCYEQHGRTIHTLPTGLRIARYRQLLAWSTGVWKGDWLAKRPRDFKAAHPVYGWTEHADIELMAKHGKTWMSHVDFYDHHLGSPDKKYQEWKQACAGGRTNKRFEEWIR